MVFLVLTSEKLRETADELEPIEEERNEILDEIKLSWLRNTKLDDEDTITKLFAQRFKMNLSEAKKSMDTFPKQYIIDDKEIIEDWKKEWTMETSIFKEYKQDTEEVLA